MSAIITSVNISKNPVKVKETFKIQVSIKETVNEPTAYRLPFALGKPKGNLNNL